MVPSVSLSEQLVGADGVNPSVPRILAPHQRHKCNVPHFSPEEYYRRAIVLPFVDHLMQETSTRFGPLQQKTVALFALVPRQQLENMNAARTTQQHATS